MNKEEKILPFFINVDNSLETISPSEAPFLKSVTFDVNANPISGAGTGNPTGEGQNLYALTTVRSNVVVPNTELPQVGWNKNCGSYLSPVTNELYYCNYNSTGQHGIYVINGMSGVVQKMIIDPELNFSDDPKAFMANHRCSLRLTKDKDGNPIEKYLLLTDGQSWQKYISVIAATKTDGFNAATFPYWTLQPPHFDRRELLEWAVRPPMVKPIVSTIPNTTADNGKINQIIDKAFQVTIDYLNTDGRQTKAGPYSLPLIVKSSDFLNNPNDIPKNAKFVLPAGSPLTERINIYVRSAKLDRAAAGTEKPEWGEWYLYDTINKFTSSGVNSPLVIGNDYWLRQNQWTNYNYNTTFNTIDYVFDNSKALQIIADPYFRDISTSMPQLSYAMTDLGDSMLLGDNRYGYDNFTDDVMDNLSVSVVEKSADGCILPLRDMYFYAYIGRPSDLFNYTSQVGFTLGTDTTVRWGGLNAKSSNGDVTIDVSDSKAFDLTFSDKQAFQLYLKGTQYSAIGEWYKVNADNSFVKLGTLYDFSDPTQVAVAGGVFAAGGYFMCRFKVTAPAGRYIAALGRHNVPLADDYRNTSTYVYGIANSRVKSVNNGFVYIRPNSINSFSKEIEVDCTSGDIDLWGNGNDMFYVYCPYATVAGNRKFRFIEGYFREDAANSIPVELFPYNMNHAATDDCGQLTDKNGFYWAYTKVANSNVVDIQMTAKVDCAIKTFTIPTSQGGIGWKVNAPAYLYNYGSSLGCNRILYTGKITDLTGALNYSNVAISIKDGATVYTKQDGTFTLIIHNGQNTLRQSNVYVNAGGNFIITIAACGYVPLFYFDENFVACVNCAVRTYPIPLNLGVKIDTVNQTSVKEGSKYTVSLYGADLAGRVMFVNEIESPVVPSFLERNNTNATFFRMLIAGALNLSNYPDIKWIFQCVTKNLSQRRYLDWVGDSINYIDNNGNVVTDVANAVFCSINITSLYNYNVANNFSVLANYQFVTGDRLRIYDDGEGHLFDIATYGDPIDLEVFGTNFNQAAINAGLLPPATNTVFNTTAAQTTQNQSVTLIVRYDARLDKIIKKTGFWIETYTPTKETDLLPYLEVGGGYPVINGEIAEYTGGGAVNPQYNYPVSIDIDFWDTYYLSRNITIPNVGNKFFSHIFQSPNITDNWGELITSGGRINVKNKNAQQLWFGADTIKSDDFVKQGLINGLATFYSDNRRNFSTYPFGDITAMISARNVICMVCENDYFIVDYNYHYTYANEQGVMVTNLSNGLSTPHQKVKGKYGMAKEDTGTLVVSEEGIFWLDNRNTGYIKMDYRTAVDISQLTEEAGEKGGIQTYLNSKLTFINQWNNTHDKKDRFDTFAGIDAERGNLYLTFRPRRNNTNDLTSYVNQRRDIDLKCQETVVYSIQYHSWMMFAGFTGEGYNMLTGNNANVEFVSFAAGRPYYHNNTPNNSFLNFYGQQTEPVIKGVFNGEKDMVLFYKSIAHNSNPNCWFIDMMYTNFWNSFTWLSANQFQKREGQYYAAILRNANSYPSNSPDELFRSQLFDGGRIVGRYLIFRMVGKYDTLNGYNQLGGIYVSASNSGNNKK